ncbi:MAG: triose-phosphate isomerase [Candidatus Kerfeldbacteria bacterium]|nr:triose-phosphate isomerase [Candidatus Kerfeldbacteria bacterium]
MQRLIIANWKMQLTVSQAVHVALMLRHSRLPRRSRLVLCPSATAIGAVSRVLHGSPIALGGQDLSPSLKGPYTGDVSARDLKAYGCQYVIVGHSDRRALGETDAQVNAKVKTALGARLTPVLCIGERWADRKAGRAVRVVQQQLRSALERVSPAQRRNVLVTYEPVWAISPGGPIAPAEAFRMARVIWRTLGGRSQPLIYGGSVVQRNAASFLDGVHFRGGLVGQASLRARSLVALL